MATVVSKDFGPVPPLNALAYDSDESSSVDELEQTRRMKRAKTPPPKRLLPTKPSTVVVTPPPDEFEDDDSKDTFPSHPSFPACGDLKIRAQSKTVPSRRGIQSAPVTPLLNGPPQKRLPPMPTDKKMPGKPLPGNRRPSLPPRKPLPTLPPANLGTHGNKMAAKRMSCPPKMLSKVPRPLPAPYSPHSGAVGSFPITSQKQQRSKLQPLPGTPLARSQSTSNTPTGAPFFSISHSGADNTPTTKAITITPNPRRQPSLEMQVSNRSDRFDAYSTPIRQWGAQQVSDFVFSLAKQSAGSDASPSEVTEEKACFHQYSQMIALRQINGQQLIELDREDLKRYGVPSLPHRKFILESVHNLVENAEKCQKCGKIVSAKDKIIHETGVFHEQCYVCDECSTMLSGKIYGQIPDDDDPNIQRRYCKTCLEKKL